MYFKTLTFDSFSNEEFDRVFSDIVMHGDKDKTYKFAFARFLLDYSNDNTETHVDYSTIAKYFLKYYWPQVCKLDIKHAPQANKRPVVVSIIKEQFDESYYGQQFGDIKKSEPEKVQKCIDQITKRCFHDVTWRFQKIKDFNSSAVWAFFEYKVARVVNNNRKYVDLDKGIDLNPEAMKFFRTHYKSCLSMVVQEWIRFLRKVNSNRAERIEEDTGRSFYDVLRKASSLKLPIDHDSLRIHVWEGLNSIGRTMPSIQDMENRHVRGSDSNREHGDKPIWHTKSEIDILVADRLGIDVGLFGPNKSKNPFYKAVVNEISRLRKRHVLIDWDTAGDKKLGVGIWRLDKTKLDEVVYGQVKYEMDRGDFYSAAEPRTVYVRQKQQVFRSFLLKDYQKCALCGFHIPAYMIGAHIVPYRIMRINDPGNAMNPTNGMLLCRLCDTAFENGAIKVDQNLGIDISELLKESTGRAVRSWIGNIPTEMELRKGMIYPPDPKYLEKKTDLLDNAREHSN